MTIDALDLHLADAQRELYEGTRTAAAQQLRPIERDPTRDHRAPDVQGGLMDDGVFLPACARAA
jgi:hypothetical protein